MPAQFFPLLHYISNVSSQGLPLRLVFHDFRPDMHEYILKKLPSYPDAALTENEQASNTLTFMGPRWVAIILDSSLPSAIQLQSSRYKELPTQLSNTRSGSMSKLAARPTRCSRAQLPACQPQARLNESATQDASSSSTPTIHHT